MSCVSTRRMISRTSPADRRKLSGSTESQDGEVPSGSCMETTTTRTACPDGARFSTRTACSTSVPSGAMSMIGRVSTNVASGGKGGSNESTLSSRESGSPCKAAPPRPRRWNAPQSTSE